MKGAPWRRAWIPVLSIVLILAGIFAAAQWRMREHDGVTHQSVLGLVVSSSGGALRLAWDRDTPVVQAARDAALSITDGNHQSRLELDRQQLRTGSVTYWPENNDVNFRLEVKGPAGYAVESVRAIRPALPGVAAAPSEPVAQPGPEIAEAAKPGPQRPSAFAAVESRDQAEEEELAAPVGKAPRASPAETPKPSAALTPMAPAVTVPEPPKIPVTPPAAAVEANSRTRAAASRVLGAVCHRHRERSGFLRDLAFRSKDSAAAASAPR